MIKILIIIFPVILGMKMTMFLIEKWCMEKLFPDQPKPVTRELRDNIEDWVKITYEKT